MGPGQGPVQESQNRITTLSLSEILPTACLAYYFQTLLKSEECKFLRELLLNMWEDRGTRSGSRKLLNITKTIDDPVLNRYTSTECSGTECSGRKCSGTECSGRECKCRTECSGREYWVRTIQAIENRVREALPEKIPWGPVPGQSGAEAEHQRSGPDPLGRSGPDPGQSGPDHKKGTHIRFMGLGDYVTFYIHYGPDEGMGTHRDTRFRSQYKGEPCPYPDYGCKLVIYLSDTETVGTRFYLEKEDQEPVYTSSAKEGDGVIYDFGQWHSGSPIPEGHIKLLMGFRCIFEPVEQT